MTRNTTNINPQPRRARRLALILAAVGTALMVAPASGVAATKFGSVLNKSTQPSNSAPAHECDPLMGDPCTRIMVEPYGLQLGARAPKNGVIKKIRLIAGTPGSFRLQLAKARPNPQTGKVVRNGPRIKHGSSITPNPVVYKVQAFKVNLPVKKGDRLAMRTKRTSVLRCSSGGPRQFLFQPPLAVGGPFSTADATDGCWMLLQAVYK